MKNKIECKQCRRSMRLWALDARHESNHRQLCIATAISFRDGPCHHAAALSSTCWKLERGVWKEAA